MARIRELPIPGSNRGLLLLAVISGLVAAVLVFVAINQSGDDSGSTVISGTSRVVVAHRDIAAGQQITADMVKLGDVPTNLTLKDALFATERVVGEKARYPILAGEQVTLGKVGAQTKDDGLAFVVPKGMRAVAVKVDEISGVGGLLLPGDRVDVIAVFSKEDVGKDKAVTFLQNVEVLAVAQEAQEPAAAVSGADNGTTSGIRPKNPAPKPNARTVTLAVTPEQAQLLALVQENGKVWLSLRSFGDGEARQSPETPLNLFGEPSTR
ncbi:MAG TPA: Flp pilus assembly protein CpaB [Dehalococcoidia bacterium]|nr:Flp pilus assembly protein CpaB [Dehalococcoidia bacterium]